MRLSTGQGRSCSETPVRKGFGDHTRVGMVIGGKTPEWLPVLFVNCPEPSWGDLCPSCRKLPAPGRGEAGPGGHHCRCISVRGAGCSWVRMGTSTWVLSASPATHGNPPEIWDGPRVGRVPVPSPPLNSSPGVCVLGHVCLVLCPSSVALPL